MSLPLVDTFTPAYEALDSRPAMWREMFANVGFGHKKNQNIASISDASAAAHYMAKAGADQCLANHIQTVLSNNRAYKDWQNAMPSKTPADISRYQKKYRSSNLAAVSEEIEQYGSLLSQGQCLFHAGRWSDGNSQITTRPLSTSLCPQVALRNAEWNAKAYNAGRLDLWVLRVSSPKTKAFVFKRIGTTLGHESEVLLASGASLKLKDETLIRSNYPASKYNCPNKEIPIYVVEIELS